MKKYLIFSLFLLILLPMVSADGIGTFKQRSVIELPQYCSTGDCTYANLSKVIAPNGEITVIEGAMTQVGQNFNYTFTETDQIGIYHFITYSNPGGVTTYDDDTFEITPSGFVGNIGFYILFFVLAFGLIILGYYIEDAWVVMLGSFLMVLFGLYVLFYGLMGMKDTAYTYGIGIVTLMLGGYFGLRAGLEKMGE